MAMKSKFSFQVIFFNSSPFCLIQVSIFFSQPPLYLWFRSFSKLLINEGIGFFKIHCFSSSSRDPFLSSSLIFSSFSFYPNLSLFSISPPLTFVLSFSSPIITFNQSDFCIIYPFHFNSFLLFQPIIILHFFFSFFILINNCK